MPKFTQKSNSDQCNRRSVLGYNRRTYMYCHCSIYGNCNCKYNNTKANISTFLVICAIISCACIYNLFHDTTLYMVPGSTMYTKTSSMFDKVSLTCKDQNINLNFLKDNPSFCYSNKIIFSEQISLKAPECLEHPHYLNMNDTITIKQMPDVNVDVYVLTDNNFTISKENIKKWHKPITIINNTYKFNVPTDGIYHIVIESNMYYNNEFKFDYEIIRNMYCAKNDKYTYKCDKKIGSITNIKIPKKSKGVLITFPTENFKYFWKDEIHQNTIYFKPNLWYIAIILCLMTSLIKICVNYI